MHKITRRKPCLLERKQKCKKGLDDITSAKGENFSKTNFQSWTLELMKIDKCFAEFPKVLLVFKEGERTFERALIKKKAILSDISIFVCT